MLCPNCNTQIHCGTAGLANLKKNHHRRKTCLKAKEKRHKEEEEAKRPTLFSFFSRQQPVPVHSSITPSALLQGGTLASMAVDIPTVSTEQNIVAQDTQDRPIPVTDSFLEKLLNLTRLLPDTVPEATDYDKLSVFAGNP